MRVTKEQAQATRRHIIETASALFRERGFDGIGLADLMKASGLTHGGFYRHFGSKDELAAEAAAVAYDQLERETDGKPIDDVLSRYIAPWHRDDLAHGCPTSALGGDSMRQAQGVQTVFAERIGVWLDMLDKALEEEVEDAGERRAKAVELATRAVGALVLSRAAAADRPLSDEILTTSLASALASAHPNK